jgi:predicted ATPase
MKRKQTRYETEAEIIAEIDHAKANATKNNSDAEQFEAQAQEAIKKAAALEAKAQTIMTAGPDWTKMMREVNQLESEFHRLKARARGSRKRAKSLEEVRIPNLSRTLAAFRTQPMSAICGQDVGVVYQTA